MSVIHDIYQLRPSEELPSSPATMLKNTFKKVYTQADQSGAVSITRSRKREYVMLSVGTYDRLLAGLKERDPLNTLRKEYDIMFESVQSDGASAAYDEALNASPE